MGHNGHNYKTHHTTFFSLKKTSTNITRPIFSVRRCLRKMLGDFLKEPLSHFGTFAGLHQAVELPCGIVWMRVERCGAHWDWGHLSQWPSKLSKLAKICEKNWTCSRNSHTDFNRCILTFCTNEDFIFTSLEDKDFMTLPWGRHLQDELIGSFLCGLIACGPTLNQNNHNLFVSCYILTCLNLINVIINLTLFCLKLLQWLWFSDFQPARGHRNNMEQSIGLPTDHS